ncbi:sensor histidine kinase [Geomesophilobacter sediminis]|uniref:histidine kinase n=1 Tax=Geomesophilobacter sediminis TaxID=2798584 RepID=A0A8J7M1A1_9BACT|nr:ATP-binding protein [Geomesophilobacter sediminis]MBJ6726825.1 HAMP domain-containing protein [Geomesophilobacter sediminis]
MRRWHGSIRLRLTLWYAAALATIILCFALGVYWSVRSSLLRSLDAQLKRDLGTVSRVIRDEPNEINELAQHGSVDLFQVREENVVLAETGDWSKAALEKANAATLPGSWSWMAPSGLSFRIESVSVTAPGHTYQVSVAEDEQNLRASLKSLGFILALGIPVALALALIGGYLLAGRVLAPIGAMAAKAREITADRLSERLPVEHDDEFGRLARVFNDTFARLEESFERLRRFTSDASHELRTPLTAIRSVGEVGLRKGTDPEALREAIGSMLEEADGLTRLVDSLLTISRAEAGTLQLKREPTDLAALAREVVDCLEVLAEEKEQAIHLEAAEEVIADLDRSTLRQGLLNIIDNAVKYAPRGGQVWVHVWDAGDEAFLEVRDDGPGIAAEHQPRVFDRFYRIDSGRSREVGGTGLGLAIARWAVEVNGGCIRLTSQPGHGSTFTIVVPKLARA